MKNKLLSVLTWLFLGVAAVAGNSALADTRTVSMTDEPAACADWSFNNPQCAAFLAPSTGRAAYGEPATGTMERAVETPLSCEDWSFNDPKCPAHLARMEGKAAYGTPVEGGKRVEMIQTSCEDWSFNDPKCPAYIRR